MKPLHWKPYETDHGFFSLSIDTNGLTFEITDHPADEMSINVNFGIVTMPMTKDHAKYKIIIISFVWFFISWGYLTNPEEVEKSEMMESLK